MEEYVNITVNGQNISIRGKMSVKQALKEHSIDIPDVCYHSSLGAIETCDTCIVQVNGEFVRTCATFVRDRDVIDTASREVKKAQDI